MLVLRSLVFNVLFYLNLIFWLSAIIPVFVMPRWGIIKAARAWAHSSLRLLEAVVGTKVEFRGLERLPKGGILVAAKHQSMWETFALLTIVDDPAFILKRELMLIPFFGWYAAKARSVAVDRSAGSKALALMNARAREEAAQGRQIMIFPEGTRRAAGAPPAYKYGVAHLYTTLGVPCVPIALNSGLYWPRRQFIRRPGTVVVEILEPIPPGLPRDTFFAEVQTRIEEASDRLLREGQAELGLLPKPSAAPSPKA